MLSTSFKFSKKDTPCNCADTKQNCVFLAFPSKLSCVSLLLRNKNYNNYMLLILIFMYLNIYIYILKNVYIKDRCIYVYIKDRCEIYFWSCCLRAGAYFSSHFSKVKWFNMLSKSIQTEIKYIKQIKQE